MRLETFGSRIVGVLLIIGAIAGGACGPLAPSVSKLSSASGNSSPTNGDSQLGDEQLVAESGALSPNGEQANVLVLEAMTLEKFNQEWDRLPQNSVNLRLSSSYDFESENFLRHNQIEFESGDGSALGKETRVRPARIIFAFDVAQSVVTSFNKNQILKGKLRYKTVAGLNGSSHWVLELVLNDPDPAQDTEQKAVFNRLKNDIRHNLRSIGIVFKNR
ncbi:MAG: hypothetical protein AB1540_05460 [Bdellovibrionota bacterium]